LKKLLVTDSHLGINKASDLYHNVVFSLFEEIQHVCIKENIRHIIHLGDFFHDRKVLNTKTQNVAHRIAELFEDIALMYLVLGNHDVYYKDRLSPTTAELFKKHHAIRPIDEITKIHGDIVLCPWGLTPEGHEGYLMGHFELKGFKMNSAFVCEHGQEPDDLRKGNNFKHIYSGHFHTPSTKNNITYLGSPYQQTFHDLGSPRGYYIWEDGEMEFREFHGAPKFRIMRSDELETEEIKGNIVRLVFAEDMGSVENQKLIDDVMSFGPVKLQVDFSCVKIEGTEEVREEQVEASLLDHNQIIEEYIGKTALPEFVSRRMLLTMINKLKGEI
jgi:DNA repair exonuclease SbcCD nuclease subunit